MRLISGRLRQQPFGFVQQKFRGHEGFIANFLPADFAFGIDEKGAMQGRLLKIIIGAIGFECFEGGVAE